MVKETVREVEKKLKSRAQEKGVQEIKDLSMEEAVETLEVHKTPPPETMRRKYRATGRIRCVLEK